MAATLSDEGLGYPDFLLSDVDALRTGSFDKLYNYYRSPLTRFARREGAQDPEGVADLALYDGFRALDRMRSRSAASFESYVYRAARSHMVAEYRRSTVPTVRLDAAPDLTTTDLENTTDKLLVESLLTQLTPDQRRVIECRFMQDLSRVATAELLGKTTNAVDQLQHRAINRLRRLLFGSALFALLVGAVWVLLQLSNPGTIDERPVDDPVIRHPEEQQVDLIESGPMQPTEDPIRIVPGRLEAEDEAPPVSRTMEPSEDPNRDLSPPARIPEPSAATSTPISSPAPDAPSTSATSVSSTSGTVPTGPNPPTSTTTAGGAKVERKLEHREVVLARHLAKDRQADSDWARRKTAKSAEKMARIVAKADKGNKSK